MSNNAKAKIFYYEIIVVWHAVWQKWAWPSKNFLTYTVCAACGLLPHWSKSSSYVYAPALPLLPSPM